MFDPTQLIWKDILTPPLTWAEYLKTITDKSKFDLHIRNWQQYLPKHEIISQIARFLTENHQNLHILTIGASWCPDCAKNLPRLAKISEKLGENVSNLHILGGVKVKLHHKPGEILWAVPPSPVECNDPKFDVVKIPTMYLFDSNGICLGRIVENPALKPTLEEEIWEIIHKLNH